MRQRYSPGWWTVNRKLITDLMVAALIAAATYSAFQALSGCSSTYRGLGEYHSDSQAWVTRKEQRDQQLGPAYYQYSSPEVDPKDLTIQMLKDLVEADDAKIRVLETQAKIPKLQTRGPR
jgi:hypothetical protein